MAGSRQRILRSDTPLILAWSKMWCRVALLICAKKSIHFLVGDHGYEKTACLDGRIDACCRYGRLPECNWFGRPSSPAITPARDL